MNEDILKGEACINNNECDPAEIDKEDESLDTTADTEPEADKENKKVEEETEDAEEESEPRDTVESLRAELEALRAELTQKREAFERMSGEINEFSELFPAVSISSIPDSVWQSVKSGIPLSAAYALYEKKTGILQADAKKVNQKNSTLSTGPIGRECTTDFFSPDEVRAMSRDEVRKNYSKIMESMKKWN